MACHIGALKIWERVLERIDWKEVERLQKSNPGVYCFFTHAGFLVDMNVFVQQNYTVMKGSVGMDGVDVPYEIRCNFVAWSGKRESWFFVEPAYDPSLQGKICDQILSTFKPVIKQSHEVYLCEVDATTSEYMGDTVTYRNTRLIRATSPEEAKVKGAFLFGCHDPYGESVTVEITVHEPVG